MQHDPDGRFKRTDIWREGKWLDLWSVAHYLSGTLVGLALYFLKFDAAAASVIAFLLFVAYELWEAMVDIEEARTNRFMDVVVGMASFAPAYFLLAPTMPREIFFTVFAAVLSLDVVLSYVGWSASRKAAELEAKMKQEYQQQRQKMRKRFGRRQDLKS